MAPVSAADELNMLKAEADSMKNALGAINQRIGKLEKKDPELQS